MQSYPLHSVFASNPLQIVTLCDRFNLPNLLRLLPRWRLRLPLPSPRDEIPAQITKAREQRGAGNDQADGEIRLGLEVERQIHINASVGIDLVRRCGQVLLDRLFYNPLLRRYKLLVGGNHPFNNQVFKVTIITVLVDLPERIKIGDFIFTFIFDISGL